MEVVSQPLIGMNAEFSRLTDDGSGRTILDAGYYDVLTAAKVRAVILPPVEDLDALPLDSLDGVLLVGCERDLDPHLDGWQLHHSVRPMHPRRETFDRKLAQWVINHRLPVLGIGVGMQLLNVIAGGTLYLDLVEDLPQAVLHFDKSGELHRHMIECEPGSLVEAAYSCKVNYRPIVTSRHHQAVDDVAPGWRVTARCLDGVVEAIESTDPAWPALGIQWHPEADGADAVERLIVETWLERVRMAGHRKNVPDLAPPEAEFPAPKSHRQRGPYEPRAPHPDGLLWRREAAEFLGTSVEYLQQLSREGKLIPAAVEGARSLYSMEQLIAWRDAPERRPHRCQRPHPAA